LRASIGDAVVLLATFCLTIFWGLAEAIVIGFALGSLLFIHRMSKQAQVTSHTPLNYTPFIDEDRADQQGNRPPYQPESQNSQLIIYHISGVFFFGAAASIGAVLDRVNSHIHTMVIDFTQVPFLDATGANVIELLSHKAKKLGITLVISGASRAVKRDMIAQGLRKAHLRFARDIDTAITRYHISTSEEKSL